MTEKIYKVEQARSSCCTSAFNGSMVERIINKAAREGWQYEGTQDIIERKCGKPKEHVLLIVLSKEQGITEV